MLVGFEKWWAEEGKSLDPDTEDVPWFDKRKGLAALAFEAGIKCGMARGGNYTGDRSIEPQSVEFANGRTVKIREMGSPDCGPFLEIGMRDSSI
jgi:hypothetical protein